MKVAVIHFVRSSDIDDNEQRLLKLNIEAAEAGANLIVNPELPLLSLSASSPIRRSSKAEDVAESRKTAQYFAEQRFPAFVEKLRTQVCKTDQTYVIASAVKFVPAYNLLYNVALVIGAEGVLHEYQKRLLSQDLVFAAQGASPLEPARLPIGNIGIIICADYSVPLLARSLMLNDSDIIVIPAAISGPVKPTLQVRAMENGIPFALANCRQHDEDWPHESAIIAADGREIKRCDDRTSTFLLGDVHISDSLRAEKRRGRRPELYQGALADLTEPLLRSLDVQVITVSGAQIEHYISSKPVHTAIVSASMARIPTFIVLPDLALDKQAIEKHIEFAIDNKLYLVCGYLQNNVHIIALWEPTGMERLMYQKVHLADSEQYQPGDRIEHYVDYAFGRIGVLAGEDLLYPEAIEAHRNAAVDLLLVPSRRSFASPGMNGAILFEDIAQARHINLAVAETTDRGGIYTRYYQGGGGWSEKEKDINVLRFDARLGQSKLAHISLSGLEAIVRID